MAEAHNERVARGLRELGIDAVEADDAVGFLEKVAIERGGIRYRPDAPASNLLHEAGHLACIPSRYRPLASGSLAVVHREMQAAYARRFEETGNPDDPLLRAIMQCSDPEATAWAWAFGMRLGIPGDVVILDDEYGGDGAEVRAQVSTGCYLGVNGLRAAGMIGSTRDYPRLTKWLQDAE